MPPHNEDGSLFTICLNVTNSITHWILGTVAMIALTMAIVFTGSDHFKQHIFLCTVGYIILMTQAILVFNPNNGWTRNMRYQDKKIIHWVMQVAGSLLAMVGSIIRIINVSNNFQTPHGIIGLIAMILTALSLAGGFVGLLSKTGGNKLIHSVNGSLALTAAFIALCLGFDKTMFRGIFGDTVANLAIAFTVIGLLGTLSSAAFSNFNRVMKR